MSLVVSITHTAPSLFHRLIPYFAPFFLHADLIDLAHSVQFMRERAALGGSQQPKQHNGCRLKSRLVASQSVFDNVDSQEVSCMYLFRPFLIIRSL